MSHTISLKDFDAPDQECKLQLASGEGSRPRSWKNLNLLFRAGYTIYEITRKSPTGENGKWVKEVTINAKCFHEAVSNYNSL